jgi:hypothetical protein
LFRRHLILLPAANDERHDGRAKNFSVRARTEQRHRYDCTRRNGCSADCRTDAQRQPRATSLFADLNWLRHLLGIKPPLPRQLARGQVTAEPAACRDRAAAAWRPLDLGGIGNECGHARVVAYPRRCVFDCFVEI